MRPRRPTLLSDVAYFLRGRLNSRLQGLLRRRRAFPAPAPPVALDAALAGGPSPIDLVPLLVGRDNDAREHAVARYLEMQGATIARHRFATFEGRGENLAVEVGEGDRALVLIAHHDAVPGSPGANDNAAAVGILLHLLARYRREPPRRLRLRFLFTACEELGYLGARAYVREMAVDGLAGVLSLELCGIGDGLVLWDVAEETPFLRHVRAGLEGLGLQADDTYHVVGRIPVFGSDHRAFAAAGLPAYGLSIIPSHHLDGLRQFVLSPVRSAAIHLVRRPPPFDTYHTRGDNLATLDPRALDRVVDALVGIVRAVEEGG